MRALATHEMIDGAAKAGAVFVFSLSGGKDCGAVSALAMRHLDALGHPRSRRIAMHADLGRAEWQITPQQVEEQAKALALDLVIVRANAGDLPARFENRWQRGSEAYRDLLLYNLRGPWSSPSLKFCQSEKKIQVMGPDLARRYRGETIVQVTGLRRDESRARATTPVAKIETRFAKPTNRAGTVMLMWNPGVDLTREQVFEINRDEGIPLSPVYDLGCSRHSCAACIMASQRDLRIAGQQEQNRPLFDLYIGMEIATTFSFQANAWLADLCPQLLSPSASLPLKQAKNKSARRREIELNLPARHRFVRGWPRYVPDHAEAVLIAEGRAEILAQHRLPNLYPSAHSVIDRFADLVEQSRRLAA